MRRFVPIFLLTLSVLAGCSETNCLEVADEVAVACSLSDKRLSRLYSDTKKFIYSGFGTEAMDQILSGNSLPATFSDINAELLIVTPTGTHIRLKSCNEKYIDLVVIYEHMGDPRIELWYDRGQSSAKEIHWKSGET